MQPENKDQSLETLHQIRSIMDRSSRFLSLSGWSGIWAGCTALIGAFIVYQADLPYKYVLSNGGGCFFCDPAIVKLLFLAAAVFLTALGGAIWFTWQKCKKQGVQFWTNASRQFIFQLAMPLIAGGIFCFAFLVQGNQTYLAPACLVFYGLALINASKFTISDIRYLGMLEVVLGCINLFDSSRSLLYWTIGFGLLHILYGIIMWNKYDKQTGPADE